MPMPGVIVAASSGVWDVAHVAGLVIGAGMSLAGLGLLWGHRVIRDAALREEPAPRRWWAGPEWLTQQMRLVAGAALMIGGYHVAAWSSPASWFPLQVPKDRWWLVPLVAGVCIGLTLVGDRLERSPGR